MLKKHTKSLYITRASDSFPRTNPCLKTLLSTLGARILLNPYMEPQRLSLPRKILTSNMKKNLPTFWKLWTFSMPVFQGFAGVCGPNLIPTRLSMGNSGVVVRNFLSATKKKFILPRKKALGVQPFSTRCPSRRNLKRSGPLWGPPTRSDYFVGH